MKRLVVVFGLVTALSILAPQPAHAGKAVMETVVADASVTLPPVGPATAVSIQIQSAAGSVVVVTVKQRLHGDAAWTTMFSVANPDAAGVIYGGPGGGIIMIETTGYVSGTINVYAEAYAGLTQLF